jgi:hypothetical protein
MMSMDRWIHLRYLWMDRNDQGAIGFHFRNQGKSKQKRFIKFKFLFNI